MPAKTTWKEIPPVPTSQEFIDIVLSRTQRRLPTQIRAGFKISRIRAFYTRKVKFTQETCSEKLGAIVQSFPVLNDIHPFHKDLLNTLYDADHFKVALGQVSTAKNLIETISRDYVRLIKYSQSLHQSKQLKIAALGRMVTLIKRLKDPLLYLDQVRQHLARLPAIDPTTRTLLIAGLPNVGKSSFVRSVSRADTPVEPYAFTTKSLFVGHFDYKYLRFQIVDTPGILDHPLEEFSTIEMQSVTALAHLRAAICFFVDASEQCGYSLQAQINLFNSIKPLFANKLVFVVLNKIDIIRPEDLSEESRTLLEKLKSSNVEILQASCATQEGIQELKNTVCERLGNERVAQKMKAGTTANGVGARLNDVLHRIHVARPLDGVQRETFIPEAVKSLKKYDPADPERRMLARDHEAANGGAGVYSVDQRAAYILKDDTWKGDRPPEIVDGMNVHDFYREDIEAQLAALEDEELKRLEDEDNSDLDVLDESDEEALEKGKIIRDEIQLIRNKARGNKSLKNGAIMPRSAIRKPLSHLVDGLDQLGVDTEEMGLRERVAAQSRGRSRSMTRSRAGSIGTPMNTGSDAMDIDTADGDAASARERLRSRSRARSQAPATNRRMDGVRDPVARSAAEKQAKLSQRKMNRMARQGEADRHIKASLDKHLVVGKRGIGKTNRR